MMKITRTATKLSAVIGILVLASTACSSSKPESPKTLPIPKRDEVVIVAGDGTDGEPRAGVFSTKTPLAAPNAMAVSPNDDALLVAADTNLQAAIVRIGSDGHTSLLDTDLPSPVRAMEVHNGEVWSLWPTPGRNAAKYSALYRQSLSGSDPIELFGGYGTKTALTQIGKDDKQLPGSAQRDLARNWYPAGLFVPTDDEPIVALANGQLFTAVGKSRVRQYSPSGYRTAIQQAGGKTFSPLAVTADTRGGFVVVGSTGAIWVSAKEVATGVRFRAQIPPTVYKGWYREVGAVVLDNGDLVISSAGKLYRARRDGSVSQITTSPTVNCKAAKKLADFGVPRRTRLARMPNGAIMMSAVEQCNRVYAFRLPGS